jgi:hypothetical protein
LSPCLAETSVSFIVVPTNRARGRIRKEALVVRVNTERQMRRGIAQTRLGLRIVSGQ